MSLTTRYAFLMASSSPMYFYYNFVYSLKCIFVRWNQIKLIDWLYSVKLADDASTDLVSTSVNLRRRQFPHQLICRLTRDATVSQQISAVEILAIWDFRFTLCCFYWGVTSKRCATSKGDWRNRACIHHLVLAATKLFPLGSHSASIIRYMPEITAH